MKELVKLYINAYDYKRPKCPKGFTYFTADNQPKIKTYPHDSIRKVQVCQKENIYAVDDFLLAKEIGDEYQKPEEYPTCQGGLDPLKSYFKERPLTDNRAAAMVFRVSISFIVNCEGQPGNFSIISRGKGDLEELANQVLERVNNMPVDWQPARATGRAVDCYQVLSFTVAGGQLDNMSYRVKN